ncbi:MAG: serine/threonine protein kinase [Proteobacteria bacterium]|nr:serine/threonine protein kinase [Pseudomonadota bacterium]
MPRSTHIGPYRILRLINRGGQGTVYLGFDDRLHRRVAIKIYRLPQDKHERRGLLHEAQLVASIQNPKVVQIYDLIVASDHVALIMEYVPGCDLEEFLDHGQPCLASIVAICIDVAGALAAARQQGIVHGDLKAGNILITEQGRVKLTDFGIARGEGDLGVQTSAASLSCISPEQYLGKSLDVRSDLFALGCLLYRMLTGKLPFVHAGELDSDGLLLHAPQAVDELVSAGLLVPPELSQLMQALLQKSPDDRPGNTHQVRNTLREISRDIPLSAGNTLLREAEVYFRRESPEDIPPLVPSDLTRNGRSSMKPNRYAVWAGVFSKRRALAMALAVIITSALFGNALVQAFFAEKVSVTLETPSFNIATAADLPGEISANWLLGEIEAAVHAQLGSVDVSGGIAAPQNKTYYSRGDVTASATERDAVQWRIRSELHCVDQLCLLALVLEKDGQKFAEQVAIFAEMPIYHWKDTAQGAALALLKRAN